MITTYINLGILFILLFLSGFFSGSETALFSLTDIQKKEFLERFPKKGNIINSLLETPGKLIITIILGNEFVNVSISTISAGLIITVFGKEVPWINIFIVLPTVLLLGEIVPKTFAINNNKKFASFIAYPLSFFNKIITPFRWLIHHISDNIVNIFVREESRGGNILTEDVVKTIIEEGEKEGVLDREEKYYINKIFDFGDTLLRDIMTPRSNLFALPIDMPLSEMIKKIKEKHYSAVPVYENNIDNIKGILFATDLIGLSNDEINQSRETLERLMRKPVIIAETTRADQMFKKFQQQKFAQFFAAPVRIISPIYRIIGEKLAGKLWVGFPEFQCCGINSMRVICKFFFEFAFYFPYIWHYAVIKEVGKMRHPIENPKSGIVFIIQNISVAFGPGFGHAVNTAVKRNVNSCSCIIHSKPVDSANGIGKPASHLRNKRKSGLLGNRCSFIKIFLSVMFPGKTTPAIGQSKRTGACIL